MTNDSDIDTLILLFYYFIDVKLHFTVNGMDTPNLHTA